MTMKLAVVVLRNLSAGWLGAYGNEWVATPNLDRLAAEGIVFERHIAERTDGQSDSYAELGKRFAGISIRTFDDLVPPWDVPMDVFASYAEEFPERTLVPVTDPVTGPFDRNDWDAWDALRCSYAAVLTRLDAKLGRLFEELHGQTIAVTSDRGFPLGEHGTVGGTRPHVELVHLPLIVRLPDGIGSGERVDAWTQPTDLLSAIIRSSDHASRSMSDLHELSEIWTNFPDPPRRFALTRTSLGQTLAIRTDEWTYILPMTSDVRSSHENVSDELYRFPDDRREQNDLAKNLPEVLDALVAIIARPDDYSNNDG